MYQLIQISKINDFVFCPHSLYLHSIYDSFSQKVYHRRSQTRGKAAHKNIDYGKYSTSKHILQGLAVYSQKYKLIGKIDLYDKKEKSLIERKYKIKQIYDGYRYQLYAEMFCMEEMGYEIKKLLMHSLADNKRYTVPLPTKEQIREFETVLDEIWQFDAGQEVEDIPKSKCENCIYSQLCDFSKC